MFCFYLSGKGVLQEFFDNTDNTISYTPLEIFTVTRGKRYRFRTISNGILNCPIQVCHEPVREKTNNSSSDQVRHKPGCIVTEVNFGFRK